MDCKLPNRTPDSHKGTYGKVLNIAGSRYMPGAAYLSSVSALKTGCGYCFLASEECVFLPVSAQAQNIIFVPFKDIDKQTPDILTIGCGLSTSGLARSIFKDAINIFQNIPVIIDADGLNLLAKTRIPLPENLLLTPHPAEAARLLCTDIETIQCNREISAKQISAKYNCITVLKGHDTVVCSKEAEIYINKTGGSALAKAGSGDVLTGIIAGLAAQGLDLFEAAKTGVYLHGLCGDIASETLSEYCVLAQDLIDFIPQAYKKLISNLA